MNAPVQPASDGAENHASLRRLTRARWFVLTGAVLAVAVVPVLLGIALPLLPLAAVLALVAAWNGAACLRLNKTSEATDAELFSQICLDLVAFAAMIFFSGGATNPLISLLLPPVAVAALTLPLRHVLAVAGLAVAAYSLLMFEFVPLPLDDPARAARLHLAGMWLTFVISAAMIAWFVVRMTAAIRERDAELARSREQALRDERVLALGTLAAGAAHELGTPLATMALLAGELRGHAAPNSQMWADLDLLGEQIAHCKRVITRLSERAGAERAESAGRVRCDEWLVTLHDGWRALRGDVDSTLAIAGGDSVPLVVIDPTLEQAIVNLLDNAARAGPPVELRADWSAGRLRIEICDHGPGFPAEVLAQAGRAPFPAHGAGSGIGLLLTHAAIERLGGGLRLANGEAGGVATIDLPLARISP